MNAPVNVRLYLPMVAQMVANQTGVKVVFSDRATTASTNGSELIIPTRFGTESTEDNLALIRGFIAHEGVGHNRHTDFKAWSKFSKKNGVPALGMHLLNVIEDPRIEKAAIKIYPGVRSMLHEMVNLIQKLKPDFFNHDGKAPITPASAVSGMLLNRLRKEELGQNCDPAPFVNACHEFYGKELTEKIYKLGLEGTRGKNTSEAIAATEGILAMMKEEADKKPEDKPEEKPESGKGEGDPQQGQPNGAGEQPGESDSQGKPPKGKGRGKNAEKPEEKSQGQKAQEAAKDALNDQSGSIKGNDLNDALEDLIKKSVDASPSRDSNVPYSFQEKQVMTGLNPVLEISTSQRGSAIRVAASLEELLQAKVDEKEYLDKSGRLVGSRLAQVKLNNLQVFERETDEVEGLSTVLQIMLDGSGSMSTDQRGLMANEAVVILGESLSKFDVPFGVSYFHDHVIDAKQFGETWQTIKGRFQNVVARGGTPIISALTHAHDKLVGRPEVRKVALIVTDGTYNVDWRPCINAAALAGIEMRFVVIGKKENKAVIETMLAIQTAGAVASLVERTDMLAISIIESLKTVF